MNGHDALPDLFSAAPMLFGDVDPATLDGATVDALRRSKSPSTLTAYAGDLSRYEAWAADRGTPTLPSPPEHLANYAAHMHTTGRAVSTIRRALSAIAFAHRLAGMTSPTDHRVVTETVAGIARDQADTRRADNDETTLARRGPRTPLLYADIVAILSGCDADSDLVGLRNRALVLLGWHSAMRRSELAGLRVEDLTDRPYGLAVDIGASKGDQEGDDPPIGVAYADNEWECPVRTVKTWLAEAGIDSGPVFRKVDRYGHVADSALAAGSVAALLKRLARRVGVPPQRVAGHSLRAGHATQAALDGASVYAIRDQMRHANIATTSPYVRRADPAAQSTSRTLGRSRTDDHDGDDR